MKTKLSKAVLYHEWMQEVPAHLQDRDGIKYQIAAAACVYLHLEQKGSGWVFQPTTPGDDDDRRGIDGFLINEKGIRVPIDFSLEHANNPAGHKKDSPWWVYLDRRWFEVQSDGSIEVLKNCETHLFRSFLPALTAGMRLLAAA